MDICENNAQNIPHPHTLWSTIFGLHQQAETFLFAKEHYNMVAIMKIHMNSMAR